MGEETERQIRPRTDAERRAYTTGYASAVGDIAKHGLQFGSEQVRLMVEADLELREWLGRDDG